MTTYRDPQEGSSNYRRFLKFYRFLNRYRDSSLYRWIHGHQKLALSLVILLGLAILLFLIGFLLAGINLVQ